jgi:hypothetical protein
MGRYRSHYFSCKIIGMCLVGNEDGRPRKVHMAGLVCADHTHEIIQEVPSWHCIAVGSEGD